MNESMNEHITQPTNQQTNQWRPSKCQVNIKPK